MKRTVLMISIKDNVRETRDDSTVCSTVVLLKCLPFGLT